MSWKNTEHRYGSLSIGLHWLMLVLIAVVYFTMEFRGLFPKGTDGRELMKQTHFMLGLSIFALVWVRLIARLIGGMKTKPHAVADAQGRPIHMSVTAVTTPEPLPC